MPIIGQTPRYPRMENDLSSLAHYSPNLSASYHPPLLLFFLHSSLLPCTAVTGLPRKLIYGSKMKGKKIINVAILPVRPAQFSGLRGAGKVEFVIIARKRGGDNKGTLFRLNVTLRARERSACEWCFGRSQVYAQFRLSFPFISSSNYRWDERAFSDHCLDLLTEKGWEMRSEGHAVICKTLWTVASDRKQVLSGDTFSHWKSFEGI